MESSSQTLDRGLTLLRLLADAQGPMTISALAAKLDVSRQAVYRLIGTLESHGLARRDADGGCRLGLGVLELARRVQPLLRLAAVGPLRRLAEQAGATAHLTVVDGGEALAIAVVEPTWTDFHVAYRVGSRHSLESGAAGRAILSGRDAPSGAVPAFVVTSGELQTGAQGIAAPVLGVEGLEASVGVVAIGELDTARVGPLVVTAAGEVAAALT